MNFDDYFAVEWGIPPHEPKNEPQSAVELAENLVRELRKPLRHRKPKAVLLARVRVLAAAIEHDPTFFLSEMVVLRNRIHNIRALLRSDEMGAAAWEANDLAHRLRRWGGDDSSGAPSRIPRPRPKMPRTTATMPA